MVRSASLKIMMSIKVRSDPNRHLDYSVTFRSQGASAFTPPPPPSPPQPLSPPPPPPPPKKQPIESEALGTKVLMVVVSMTPCDRLFQSDGFHLESGGPVTTGHTSDLNSGTQMATLSGAWHFRVSSGTGRPGVSILCLSKIESLICSAYICLSRSAPEIH